jgi:hypothetical protein
MPIELGPGITVGPGIVIGGGDAEVYFISAEDNDPLITENDLNLITET